MSGRAGDVLVQARVPMAPPIPPVFWIPGMLARLPSGECRRLLGPNRWVTEKGADGTAPDELLIGAGPPPTGAWPDLADITTLSVVRLMTDRKRTVPVVLVMALIANQEWGCDPIAPSSLAVAIEDFVQLLGTAYTGFWVFWATQLRADLRHHLEASATEGA